jgi:hypothetical protein
MRKLFISSAAAALVALSSAGVLVLQARQGPTPLLAALADVPHAPAGQRIRVQVLNTTKTRGLARRATRLLGDRGFDVVDIGNVSPTIDTTIVLDLSGHPAWADVAAKIMAPARTRARTDSSRYLDVTVLIGSSWRPPAEPLHP